jgi:hypothetical protein
VKIKLMSSDNAAPPEMQKLKLPPKNSRSFEKTILSAMLCLTASRRGTGCPRSVRKAYSLPTSIAQSKIFLSAGSIAPL